MLLTLKTKKGHKKRMASWWMKLERNPGLLKIYTKGNMVHIGYYTHINTYYPYKRKCIMFSHGEKLFHDTIICIIMLTCFQVLRCIDNCACVPSKESPFANIPSLSYDSYDILIKFSEILESRLLWLISFICMHAHCHKYTPCT